MLKQFIRLSSLLILLFCMFSSVSANDEELKNATFIEYTSDTTYINGTNFIDTLENYNGTISGATCGEIGRINQSCLFDGVDDYIDLPTIGDYSSNNDITYSFWFKTNSTGVNTILNYNEYLGTDETFLIRHNNGQISLYSDTGVFNGGNGLQGAETDLNDNEWHHVVIAQDGANSDNIVIYVDGVFSASSSIDPNIVVPDNEVNIATETYSSSNRYFFEGNLDEIIIFDEYLSSGLVSELYNRQSNNLAGAQYPFNSSEEPPQEEVEGNIINSTLPLHNADFEFKETFSIQAVLNYEVDKCDLYFNNEKIKTYTSVTSLNQNLLVDNVENIGDNTFYIYCTRTLENNTLEYEFSETKTITINQPDPTEVIFNIRTSDFTQDTEKLYISSPCLIRGTSTAFLDGYEPFRSEVNPNGAYLREVSDQGVAKFEMPFGNHSFCLYNGNMIIQEQNKSANYEVVNIEGNTNLGTLNIPIQEFIHYEISLEKFDVYDKTNPKAWGQTWAGIFTSLILFILGMLIIIIGATKQTESAGKIVFVGSLLILSAFGINLNIFTGVLF